MRAFVFYPFYSVLAIPCLSFAYSYTTAAYASLFPSRIHLEAGQLSHGATPIDSM